MDRRIVIIVVLIIALIVVVVLLRNKTPRPLVASQESQQPQSRFEILSKYKRPVRTRYRAFSLTKKQSVGYDVLTASNTDPRFNDFLTTMLRVYSDTMVLGAIKKQGVQVKYEFYFGMPWSRWYHKFSSLIPRQAFQPPPFADKVSYISIDVDDDFLNSRRLKHLNLYHLEKVQGRQVMIENTLYPNGDYEERARQLLALPVHIIDDKEKFTDWCQVLGMIDQTETLRAFRHNIPDYGKMIDIANKGQQVGLYFSGLTKENLIRFSKDQSYDPIVTKILARGYQDGDWAQIGFHMKRDNPTALRSALYLLL